MKTRILIGAMAIAAAAFSRFGLQPEPEKPFSPRDPEYSFKLGAKAAVYYIVRQRKEPSEEWLREAYAAFLETETRQEVWIEFLAWTALQEEQKL